MTQSLYLITFIYTVQIQPYSDFSYFTQQYYFLTAYKCATLILRLFPFKINSISPFYSMFDYNNIIVTELTTHLLY